MLEKLVKLKYNSVADKMDSKDYFTLLRARHLISGEWGGGGGAAAGRYSEHEGWSWNTLLLTCHLQLETPEAAQHSTLYTKVLGVHFNKHTRRAELYITGWFTTLVTVYRVIQNSGSPSSTCTSTAAWSVLVGTHWYRPGHNHNDSLTPACSISSNKSLKQTFTKLKV